jgi:thiosulfate/3-mercaptopyruvate sulfurtransferase
MNWSSFLMPVIIIVFIFSCGAPADSKIDGGSEEIPNIKAESEHLIYVNDLFEKYLDENVVIVDFRESSQYLEGHIPGAINLYRTDITCEKEYVKGLISSKDSLEYRLGVLGVSSDKKIIVYDGKGACEASRFWWTMNYYGFTDVQVLNGDFDLWKSRTYPVDHAHEISIPTSFIFPESNKNPYSASKQDVLRAIDDTNVVIVDSRTIEEYTGEILKKGAFRKGRIPTSIHVDWANSIDYDGSRECKNVNDLKYDLERKGITKDKEVIFYCQSGTRSAHSTFVLTQLLGYENVKNYDGSWIEWSQDLSLQIERD